MKQPQGSFWPTGVMPVKPEPSLPLRCLVISLLGVSMSWYYPCMEYTKNSEPTLPSRFWAKVVKRDNGCWEWTASRYKNGYGKLGAESPSKSTVYAHRVSWQLNFGAIPAGYLVCHRCDNRVCVRPSHLFLGTAKDNSQDCLAKGRQVAGRLPGEKHHQAKLNTMQVLEIHSRLKNGEHGHLLAIEFGVGDSAISRIKREESWTHLWEQ